LSNKDRRSILDYAKVLAKTAATAPNEEMRIRTNQLSNSIRQEYGFSRETKIEDVMYHVNCGCWTVDDLVSATMFKLSDVQDCLQELEKRGRVRKMRPDVPGLGRMADLYKPTSD